MTRCCTCNASCRWVMPPQGGAELRSGAPLMLEVSADMAREERQVGHQALQMTAIIHVAVTLPTPA